MSAKKIRNPVFIVESLTTNGVGIIFLYDQNSDNYVDKPIGYLQYQILDSNVLDIDVLNLDSDYKDDFAANSLFNEFFNIYLKEYNDWQIEVSADRSKLVNLFNDYMESKNITYVANLQ